MHFLFRVLLVVIIGSFLVGDVAAQLLRRNQPQRAPAQRAPAQENSSQSMQPSAPSTQLPVANVSRQLPNTPLYRSLLTERHALQESIESAIFWYRNARLEVHERTLEIERHLGDRRYDTATRIEFENAFTREENLTQRQASGISPELAIAYSYWKENLHPYELHLEQISEDIDKYARSGVLERLFSEIQTIENSLQRLSFDENHQERLSTLIAESRVARAGLDSGNTIRFSTFVERVEVLPDDLSDEGYIEP